MDRGNRGIAFERADYEDWITLKFFIINSRWSGGAGFRTLEERLAEANRAVIYQLRIAGSSID